MKIFVAGATGARRQAARAAAGRRRPRGRRDDDVGRGRPTTCARSARSRSCSTCWTRRPSAEPSPRPSPRSSSTRRRRSRHRWQPPEVRRGVRADEPAAHRGHRQPARRRAGRSARGGSWPRATPAGRTRARARPVKDEEAPLDPHAGERRQETHRRDPAPRGDASSAPDARAASSLRYGGFYGPGYVARRRTARCSRRCASARSRSSASGAGMWSFIHIEDAARRDARRDRARRARALQHRRRRPGAGVGVASRTWPTRSARSRRATCRSGSAGSWPARRLATMMTEGRGASNAKAKRELGWQLLYPSWREGFVNGLKSAA